MNDLESLVRRRRSVRTFTGGDIDRRTLGKLVEMALWAPSSCNRQTVHFRFVKNRRLIDAVAPAAFNQPILGQPITLAVVCVDTTRYRNTTLKNNLAPCLDAGLAMENFLLAATAMEIGTCVVAGRLNQPLVRSVLHLPDEWIIAAFIALGVAGEGQPPPERDFAELHMSFDDESLGRNRETYGSHVDARRRWARAGFDTGRYYRHPKEGLPVYRHALVEMRRRLGDGERWLVTSTLMGAFCFDEAAVDHLAGSSDESWFIEQFLGKRIQLLPGSPVGDDAEPPEGAYDRIVSPFDVHFLDAGDTRAFMDNCARWLKPGGTLSVIFFNKRSCWNLNYRLARLLGRDPHRFRLFGYETPLSIGAVANRFSRRFRVVGSRTISFLPPPNVGYLSGRMRLLPLDLTRSFDVLGSLPLVCNLGNVAIVDFERT